MKRKRTKRQQGVPRWQRFDLIRTKETGGDLKWLADQRVNLTIPAGSTHREKVEAIAKQLQPPIPIELLDENLSKKQFERGKTIYRLAFDEIDDTAVNYEHNKRDADDDFEVTETLASVTRDGDLWQLGRHRIICGNSLEQSSFSKLLGKKRADIIFVDPPYNLEIDGNVSGKGSVRHLDFKMASGEMSKLEFVSFLASSLRLLARYSTDGSVHFVCMDWRHISELLTASQQIYDSFLNLCVWSKDRGTLGSFYRSQHELVFVFRNGRARHRNNIQLGRYGRNRTNVWNYAGINTLSKSTDEGNLLALHPTVKPVALIADALLDCSARGDVVLDGFLGAGTTVIAAERTGRACFGIEIDPNFVDTAVRRWQRYTGDRAVHAVSGTLFNDIADKKLENNL